MMDPLILYFIKAHVALTALYLIYRIFFSGDTFFGLRRVVLLLIYFISFVFPLVSLEGWIKSSETPAKLAVIYSKIMPEITIVNGISNQETDYSWLWDVGFVIYLAGVCVLFLRTLMELISIWRTLYQSPRKRINGIQVCTLSKIQEPYSFFKWICICPDMHTNKELDEILIHEQTHAKEGHSIDIILAQLATILCWFNPVVWLLRKEVRINHEFLADKHVITSGHDKKTYQYHLIGMQHQPTAAANLYNNFSVLPLKKRIKMLNKKRTRNIMKSKYLMFLPVVALLLLFSNCVNKAKNEQQATTEVKDTTATAVAQTPSTDTTPVVEKTAPTTTVDGEVLDIVEEMPEFPGGIQACVTYLAKNIKYPSKAQDAKEQGRVIVQFVVSKEGKIINPKIVRSVSPDLDNEAIRVIKSMPTWKPGKHKGVAVNVKYTVPVVFKL